MTHTIEMVRWTAPPERAEPLVAGHQAARDAIDAVAPGWVWSRLARMDERTWIEIVAWRTRAAFERALELAPREPVPRDWFGLADADWTLELGEHVDGDDGVPPPAGDIELTTSGGDDADLVAAPDPESRWSVLVEMDGRVWSEGEWRTTKPSLLRIGVREHTEAPACPPWTQAFTIEHAYDASAAPYAAPGAA